VLQRELRVAQVGVRVSRQRLASRLRVLYAHGSASTLEILFGATSLDQALVELDDLDHVTSINREVLTQLRSAQARIGHASRALAVREAALAGAVRAQLATTRSLAAVRAERAAYLGALRRRLELNAQQISTVEEQARAAAARSRRLTAAAPAVTDSVPIAARSGGTITVVATGYAIRGHTSTGLPTGWGVAAVDPRVIPLGTHITIPGYGTAVAADTGGSVVGATVDLWFPTSAQAAAWGRRSVTIEVH
jgi:3D (Asp-Asp-Asp) domain-containing protein